MARGQPGGLLKKQAGGGLGVNDQKYFRDKIFTPFSFSTLWLFSKTTNMWFHGSSHKISFNFSTSHNSTAFLSNFHKKASTVCEMASRAFDN